MNLYTDARDNFFCCPNCGNVDWDEIVGYATEVVYIRQYQTVEVGPDIDGDVEPPFPVLDITDDEEMDSEGQEISELWCNCCDAPFNRVAALPSDYDINVLLERFDYNESSKEAYLEACNQGTVGTGDWKRRCFRVDAELYMEESGHLLYNDPEMARETRAVRGPILIRNLIRMNEKLLELGYTNENLGEGWSVRRWDVNHHNVNIEGQERTPEYNESVGHPRDGVPQWPSTIFRGPDKAIYLYPDDIQEDGDRVLTWEGERGTEYVSEENIRRYVYLPTTLDDLDRVLKYVYEIPLKEEREEVYA